MVFPSDWRRAPDKGAKMDTQVSRYFVSDRSEVEMFASFGILLSTRGVQFQKFRDDWLSVSACGVTSGHPDAGTGNQPGA